MKIKLLALCCFIVLASCSVSNDSNPPQKYKSLWHLVNVSGGVAGVNETYEVETIIWTFNEIDLELAVVNNNQDTTIQDGLDSGTYDYSILNVESKSYLSIDDNELGRLTLTQNSMVINENEMSTATGADGFLYTFQLQLVPIQ